MARAIIVTIALALGLVIALVLINRLASSQVGAQTSPASALAASQETTMQPPSPQRDAYLKALDALSDEQAEMVPVVLATVGELACDGIEVDRRKTAGFIAAHASDQSKAAREEAAKAAKGATDALLGPWLAYVHQDSAAFCAHAYALKQSGRDLWKD
jgi:hypothetical protein